MRIKERTKKMEKQQQILSPLRMKKKKYEKMREQRTSARDHEHTQFDKHSVGRSVDPILQL